MELGDLTPLGKALPASLEHRVLIPKCNTLIISEILLLPTALGVRLKQESDHNKKSINWNSLWEQEK